MFKIVVRDLDSADLIDMDICSPKNPEHFGILVQASIGIRDELGADLFDFLVCTPSWLAQTLKDKNYIWGRHYLFVAKYDYELILNTIQQLCDTIEASDWETAAIKLARYGHWEFEDYREYEDLDEDEYEAEAQPELAEVK